MPLVQGPSIRSRSTSAIPARSRSAGQGLLTRERAAPSAPHRRQPEQAGAEQQRACRPGHAGRRAHRAEPVEVDIAPMASRLAIGAEQVYSKARRYCENNRQYYTGDGGRRTTLTRGFLSD